MFILASIPLEKNYQPNHIQTVSLTSQTTHSLPATTEDGFTVSLSYTVDPPVGAAEEMIRCRQSQSPPVSLMVEYDGIKDSVEL